MFGKMFFAFAWALHGSSNCSRLPAFACDPQHVSWPCHCLSSSFVDCCTCARLVQTICGHPFFPRGGAPTADRGFNKKDIRSFSRLEEPKSPCTGARQGQWLRPRPLASPRHCNGHDASQGTLCAGHASTEMAQTSQVMPRDPQQQRQAPPWSTTPDAGANTRNVPAIGTRERRPPDTATGIHRELMVKNRSHQNRGCAIALP